jgi:hypothetical protein
MSCNIVFDYLNEHNGEYWYKCTTCGAREWFGRHSKPYTNTKLTNCRASDEIHCADYQAVYAIEQQISGMSYSKIAKMLLDNKQYIAKLEQFQEEVYEVYPQCSVDLAKYRQSKGLQK